MPASCRIPHHAFRLCTILSSMFLAFFLAACASSFTADVTRFHDLPPADGQTVQIMAKDPARQGTLEFQRYADMVGARLAALGYRPPEPGTPSDLVAGIDYGVGPGRQALRDGDGGSSVGVGVGGGSRGGVSVGLSTAFNLSGGEGEPLYVRRFYMDLTRRATDERLFEGRAESEGRTRDLSLVMPYLVDALFQEFPGESGVTTEVKIKVTEDGPQKF